MNLRDFDEDDKVTRRTFFRFIGNYNTLNVIFNFYWNLNLNPVLSKIIKRKKFVTNKITCW